MRANILAVSVALASLSSYVSAQNEADGNFQSMEIIGSQSVARALPGSGALIDEEQIRIEAASDINQLMKTVPGIYVREEDGFGLRPNIGIRAASSGRSGKITLMEDGILMAPAPYSNPAAYYFPTTLRMDSVEVLKGASLLRYGPQTTGGVVNLVSTPIPEMNSGSVSLAMGEYSSSDIHAWYGGRQGDFGFLLETAQRDTEGFKDIDRSHQDSGFEIDDYQVKLDWQGERQSLLLKMQYSEEVSNETYLGLTDVDFAADPDRRYGLSSIDQMDNHHSGVALIWNVDLAENMRLSTTAYRNDFARDWFKLGGGGDIVDDANAGDADAQAVLDGTMDAFDLGYKHNSRSYESSGVQSNLQIGFDQHRLDVGLRVHEDEMDRYQPVEVYDQINGSLVFVNTVEPTGGDNRLEEGDAFSFWLMDNWQVNDDLMINLALRYEDVESSRQQFADPERTVIDSERGNTDELWLPGASFTWDLDERWQVLGGVHKGFSPLGGGAVESQESETSINYEAGLRFRQGAAFIEAIAFYSDFDNVTENCSMANPCSNGATSGNFTTGEAEVSGIEFQASTLINQGDWTIPLDLNFTLTNAEITQTNPTVGVVNGDELANIPEQTLSFRAGLQHTSGWNNYAVIKYIDEMCVSVGCNRSNSPQANTDDLLVMDLISRYRLNTATEVFLKVENLFDEQNIVSRAPDGARPNKTRMAMVGIQYDF